MHLKVAEQDKKRRNWRQISMAGLALAGLLAIVSISTRGASASTPSRVGDQPAIAPTQVGESTLGLSLAGFGSFSTLSGKGDPTGNAAGSGAPAPAAAASPTCSPNWTAIAAPNESFAGSLLTSVAEVSPTDVWAGGVFQGDSSSVDELPFFEHWDGTSWTAVPAPLPAPGAQGWIWDMAANSSDDVWAVGYYIDGTNRYELVYRWNGLQWSIMPGPHPSATDNELYGVTAVSTDNVWAVGAYTVAGTKRTLVERWNGSTWSNVGSPNQGTGNNELWDISPVPGTSGNDLWAVGSYRATPVAAEQTLTLRWNGVVWSHVASPNQGADSNKFRGITALSANDVWAVGSYRAGAVDRTLAEHWNGSVWSISPTIDPNSSGNQLVRVFATAGNDVLATGVASQSSTPNALVEHWNGSAWSVAPNTAAGAGSYSFGIDGGSSSDVWIVGFYAPSLASSTAEVLLEHYNGATWGQVIAPNPPNSADVFMSVSAASASDIWAVGKATGYAGGNLTTHAIIEHWNGSTWSLVTSPHPTTYGDELFSVKARSANDVWAVGDYSNATSEQTFIEHWNGSTWSQIASPNPGGGARNNDLYGVDEASANNAWAVGSYHNGTTYQTLILHWDGTVWLQFTSASPGAASNFLYDVTVVPGSGGNDAWAVGNYNNAPGGHYSTLLERWNGSAWSVVSSPNVAVVDNRLASIFALSANDVWAVGYTTDGSSPSQNLALHWNGTNWSIVPAAQQGPYDNELSDVTGTASNDVYAIGYYITAGAQEHGLVEHWNGSAWSVESSVQTPGIGSLLAGVTAVSSSDIWTVGEYRQAGFDDVHVLTMRYHPCVVSCSITFSDVPPGSTFYPYIHCLACLGIINGYPDGTFKPNANVTRGQLSKIVANSAGFSDAQPNQMFQDVAVGSTFQAYIGRLASRGYINGYACGGAGEPCVPPGNLPYFRPNNNATRGQISKIVSNAAGFSNTPSGQQFQDVAAGSTYYAYIYRLVSRGVMSGYPCGGVGEPCVPPGNLPYFRPNNNATRGQTSKIVGNTFFPECSSTAGSEK